MHSTSKAGDVVYLISNRRLSETCFNRLKSLGKKKNLKNEKHTKKKIQKLVSVEKSVQTCAP